MTVKGRSLGSFVSYAKEGLVETKTELEAHALSAVRSSDTAKALRYLSMADGVERAILSIHEAYDRFENEGDDE